MVLDDIDPIYYEHTYYLAPTSSDGGAAKASACCWRRWSSRARSPSAGSCCAPSSTWPPSGPLDGALALSTMLFADEVVDKSDIDELPSGKKGEEGERQGGRRWPRRSSTR